MLEAIASTAISAGQKVVRAVEAGLAPAASSPAPVQPGGDLGFDSVLKQVASDTIGSLKTGEAASISAIQGGQSTRKVVESLMSAERSLQTAVAVRDKVVQAYQEVVRMSI